MNKKYRIAIDARFFATAGPGRYTKAIVEHLALVDKENEYIVFMKKEIFDTYEFTNPNFKKVLANYPWYSWTEQILFLLKILVYRPHLLYVPHFNIPVLYPGKLVTAIPDLIMSDYTTTASTTIWKPYFLFKKYVYHWVIVWALLRSYKNIVPSNATKEDFLVKYPYIPADKHVLAYEGIDPDLLDSDVKVSDVLEKYNVEKPFLLCVGSAYEHKNLTGLVDAFEILVNKYKYKGSLVLVGKKDKFAERLRDLVHSKHLEDRVIIPVFTSFVTDEEVVAFRKGAEMYVFPSLKEGFSLTPMEAQYHKLPCAISDIECHREIYGDSVEYFNPKNPEDIALKVNALLQDKDLQKELITKGLHNIKNFDWMNTARITKDVFMSALGNFKHYM
jgi:glycosyltransferase involved in cell wall biosynthesis